MIETNGYDDLDRKLYMQADDDGFADEEYFDDEQSPSNDWHFYLVGAIRG